MSLFVRQLELPRIVPAILMMFGVTGILIFNYTDFGLITVKDGVLLSIDEVQCDWYCENISTIKTTTGTYAVSGTVHGDAGADIWIKSSGDRLAAICVGIACYDVKK